MYKNYIFDLYGTLVDICTDEYSTIFWQKVACFFSFKGAKFNAEELQQAYNNEVLLEKSKIKDTKYPDIKIELIVASLYLSKDIIANKQLIEDTCHFFRITSCKYIRLYPGVLDLLCLLKEKGKKVFLLSNAQRIFTKYELDYLGITKYFDDILLSSDYMICKPDKNFYLSLINKNNLSIKDSIMIGNDSKADIQGANNIGLSSFYIHSNLSPAIEGSLNSTYALMEFNISNIAPLIIK